MKTTMTEMQSHLQGKVKELEAMKTKYGQMKKLCLLRTDELNALCEKYGEKEVVVDEERGKKN